VEYRIAIADSLRSSARALYAANEYTKASEVLGQALEMSPDDPSLRNDLGLCLLALGRFDEAAREFLGAIGVTPDAAALHHNLGLALRRAERSDEAAGAFQRATELEPREPSHWLELSLQLQLGSRWPESIECLELGLERIPSSTHLMLALATAYGRVGRSEAAEEIYRRAVAAEPAANQAYGFWLQGEGRTTESAERLLAAIEADPLNGQAYFGLAQAGVRNLPSGTLLDRILGIRVNPRIDLRSRMFLSYALGRIYEEDSEPGPAMREWDEANAAALKLYNRERAYDKERARRYRDGVKAMLTRDVVTTLREGGSGSETPILVVGMIRSGTTLLDQILSSHPEVRSAGELQFWKVNGDRVYRRWHFGEIDQRDLDGLPARYLQELDFFAGAARRVIDKMPLNFEFLGLIHAAFPKARIVHVRRNPVDTCLSIYTTAFNGGPNFAYSRENIVDYYLGYVGLMEHWRGTLAPGSLVEVDYEELVADREPVIRRVLEAVGLEWSEACLHHEQNAASVSTPSRWQARRPIYASSVNRRASYDPWLREFSALEHA
jgi:tetratricopeptide (TPR) repeat protein